MTSAEDVTFEVTAPLYAVTKGDGQSYKQGSNDGLTFRFSGPLDDFTGLLMDGENVPPDAYTASKGSTVIALKTSYLDTLSTGGHTLAAAWRDGSRTETTFSVEPKGRQTGGKTDEKLGNGRERDSAEAVNDGMKQVAVKAKTGASGKSELAATGDSTAAVCAGLMVCAALCFTVAIVRRN